MPEYTYGLNLIHIYFKMKIIAPSEVINLDPVNVSRACLTILAGDACVVRIGTALE